MIETEASNHARMNLIRSEDLKQADKPERLLNDSAGSMSAEAWNIGEAYDFLMKKVCTPSELP